MEHLTKFKGAMLIIAVVADCGDWALGKNLQRRRFPRFQILLHPDAKGRREEKAMASLALASSS